MGINLNPLSGIIDSVSTGVQGIARFVTGDKVAQDEQEAVQNKASTDEFAAEFVNAPTNAWDSIVNGLNRLPRPLMVFGIMALMVWCPYDPLAFQTAMAAYALVPQWLALAVGSIILFYFGTRHREQMAKMGGPTAEQIAAYGAAKAAIKSAAPPPPPMDDKAFKADMANTAKPLSNRSVEEWNRRRHTASSTNSGIL